MKNSISRLHQLFKDRQEPLRLNDITAALNLNASHASMTLCYFMRKKYCNREQVPNLVKAGRKLVWEYTYIKH